ncbi:MAG: glycosyltransferase family 2 protein [Firmicutes bacterium]|nr:glycosyltransferase family 2 protein [Bacillota bacterium]
MAQITIGIPSYRQPQYLQRAVAALQAQTLADWELWICDDASGDDSVPVAHALAEADNRVHVCADEKNKGLAANFAQCARYGTADWLLLCAADDVLAPDFLERAIQSAQQCPDCGMICGRRVQRYPSGRLRPYPPIFVGRQAAGSTVARALTNGNLYGLYSSVVLRRAAMMEAGGLGTDNAWAGDFDLFVRMAARFPVFFDEKMQCEQWIDPHTQTRQMAQDGRIVRGERQMLEHVLAQKAVRSRLTSRQVQAAWQRILAMGILLGGAAAVKGNFRGAQDNWQAAWEVRRQAGPLASWRHVGPTLLRLAMQRSQLRY